VADVIIFFRFNIFILFLYFIFYLLINFFILLLNSLQKVTEIALS